MLNEFYFFSYIFVIIASLLFALKASKETLIALIALFWVLANLFVTKHIILFGLGATTSDALAVGATLGLNLVQEYYGKEAARHTIWTSFFCVSVYTVAALLQCAYLPSSNDTMHKHFCALLTPMPRLIAASLASYLVAQYLEYWLYGLGKKLFKTRYFVGRNVVSTSISQAVDTVLFSFLGLYGIVSDIGHIIIVSYSIKIITLSIAAPFLGLSLVITKKE